MSGSVRIMSGRGLRIIALMGLALVCMALAALPAAAQGFSVGNPAQEFQLCPGESFTGSIPVINPSDQPKSLKVYAGDWVRVPGQSSDYALEEEPGKEPRSLIPWMTFSPERMTLEPGESREVTFEVNVPDDWTLAGSYWGVIFIEGIPTEAEGVVPPTPEGVSVGITTVFRYAVQIFATMQDTEVRAAVFTTLNMEAAENGFTATAVFQNNGNTMIRPKVWLELHDAAGEVVYTQEHSEQTVLPESGRDFVFVLNDPSIPSGEYLVMIMGDYGVQSLIAAQGRVNLTITPPPESATTGGG